MVIPPLVIALLPAAVILLRVEFLLLVVVLLLKVLPALLLLVSLEQRACLFEDRGLAFAPSTVNADGERTTRPDGGARNQLREAEELELILLMINDRLIFEKNERFEV